MDAIGKPDVAVLLILLDAAIKGAALMLIAWGITALMRRGSAGARHLVWTCAVGAALLLPAVSAILPAYQLPLVSARRAAAPIRMLETPSSPVTNLATPLMEPVPEPVTPSDEREVIKPAAIPPAVEMSSPPPPIRHSISRAALIVVIWFVGAGVVGFYCITGIIVAARLTWRSRVVMDGEIFVAARVACEILKVRRPVGLRISPRVLTPLTAGVIRPKMLLPMAAVDWPAQQLRSVLLHELAHIKRFDRATQCVAQLACVLYWFNPLIWLAAARMRVERERACDDLVLSNGVEATNYADHLVAIAAAVRGRSLFGTGTIAMARSSDLRGRVTNILNDKVNRRVTSRRLMAVAVALTIVALVDVSVVRLSAQITFPATALTSPVEEEALPAKIPAKQFALRVLGPSGNAVRIDEIKEIQIWISKDMPWTMGPQPPVLGHFAGGWVCTDASMFTLAERNQLVEMTFVSGHHAMHVQGMYPSGAKELTFQSAADADETSIDESAGPDVGTDAIAGRVVDPQGKPVAGAVFSEIAPEGLRKALGTSFISATSDADGVFRLHDLHDRGPLFYEVRANGFATRWIGDLPAHKGFTVHLANNTRLRGSLTLPDGKPAAGATLEILTTKYTIRKNYGPLNFNVETTADASGNYDIALEPGIYNVEIKSATGATARHDHVMVTSGTTVALPAQLQEGAKLTVHAVDNVTGKPIAGVHFAIDKLQNQVDAPVPDTDRTSDAQGIAHWDGLVAGNNTRIRVKADGYARWWLKGDEHTPRGIDELFVNVSPTSSDLTVELEAGVHVQGQVLSPDGTPFGGVMVNVGGMRTGDERYQKRTDAQGRFDMVLPRVSNSEGNPAFISYAIVACDPSRRLANGVSPLFLAVPGSSQNLTIHMTPGAHVSGRVVDGSGKPVAHIEVQAVNQDTLDADYYNPRNVTDADGRFELPLRPGDYQFFPNTSYNININVPPGYKPSTVHVVEGQSLNLPDILYNGPPPGPMPRDYDLERTFGFHRTTRPQTTRPAEPPTADGTRLGSH